MYGVAVRYARRGAALNARLSRFVFRTAELEIDLTYQLGTETYHQRRRNMCAALHYRAGDGFFHPETS